MKVNVLGIVKGVAEIVVSASVGVVVGNIVKATTPDDLNKFGRITVAVGSGALGAVLGELSAKYTSAQIDGYAERLNDIIHPSEEVKDAVDDVKEAVIEVAKVVQEDTQKAKKDKPSADAE